MIDSMAALGVIAKGRSSSPPLLRLSRQLAGYSLAFGLLVYPRYIPSEINPADGPSRGVGVGAAPETKIAHADRLAENLSKTLDEDLRRSGLDRRDVARHLAEARACSGFAGG